MKRADRFRYAVRRHPDAPRKKKATKKAGPATAPDVPEEKPAPMPRNRRDSYARRRCPVRPLVRFIELPPNSIECGHCDGHIEGGMEIDYCPDHRWLCPECAHAR